MVYFLNNIGIIPPQCLFLRYISHILIVYGMWELTIPAELGYGSARIDGIPAHSTLIFILELLQIA